MSALKKQMEEPASGLLHPEKFFRADYRLGAVCGVGAAGGWAAGAGTPDFTL